MRLRSRRPATARKAKIAPGTGFHATTVRARLAVRHRRAKAAVVTGRGPRASGRGRSRKPKAHRGEQAGRRAVGVPVAVRPGPGQGAGSPGLGSACPPGSAAVKVKSAARGGRRVPEGVRPGDRRAVPGVEGAGPRPPGVRVPDSVGGGKVKGAPRRGVTARRARPTGRPSRAGRGAGERGSGSACRLASPAADARNAPGTGRRPAEACVPLVARLRAQGGTARALPGRPFGGREPGRRDRHR